MVPPSSVYILYRLFGTMESATEDFLSKKKNWRHFRTKSMEMPNFNITANNNSIFARTLLIGVR